MTPTAGPTLAERLREHFGHRDHLYGVLLAEMADDWDAGGLTRELLSGWEGAEARQFPQLRLLAGLFRLVLRGEAPQLVPYYPCLGGDEPPDDAWAAVRPVLAAHVDELRAALDEAPQTNEPARTLALLTGLSEAVRRTGLRRVRLLEPGASAGLGLLVDRYRFVGDGWAHGPLDAPLVIEGCGAAGLRPEAFDVVERRGCDVAPVDATGRRAPPTSGPSCGRGCSSGTPGSTGRSRRWPPPRSRSTGPGPPTGWRSGWPTRWRRAC